MRYDRTKHNSLRIISKMSEVQKIDRTEYGRQLRDKIKSVDKQNAKRAVARQEAERAQLPPETSSASQQPRKTMSPLEPCQSDCEAAEIEESIGLENRRNAAKGESTMTQEMHARYAANGAYDNWDDGCAVAPPSTDVEPPEDPDDENRILRDKIKELEHRLASQVAAASPAQLSKGVQACQAEVFGNARLSVAHGVTSEASVRGQPAASTPAKRSAGRTQSQVAWSPGVDVIPLPSGMGGLGSSRPIQRSTADHESSSEEDEDEKWFRAKFGAGRNQHAAWHSKSGGGQKVKLGQVSNAMALSKEEACFCCGMCCGTPCCSAPCFGVCSGGCSSCCGETPTTKTKTAKSSSEQ